MEKEKTENQKKLEQLIKEMKKCRHCQEKFG